MKSRISGERSSPLRVCANNAAIISLPQAGEGGPSKTVDEDVGSYFMGKHFGVRLFEGCAFPLSVADTGGASPSPTGSYEQRGYIVPLLRGRGDRMSGGRIVTTPISQTARLQSLRLAFARHLPLHKGGDEVRANIAATSVFPGGERIRQQCGYLQTCRDWPPGLSAWHTAISTNLAATRLILLFEGFLKGS